jgi:hypothetical protein
LAYPKVYTLATYHISLLSVSLIAKALFFIYNSFKVESQVFKSQANFSVSGCWRTALSLAEFTLLLLLANGLSYPKKLL